MAHKNAEQLIAETEEIVKELGVYENYKENLLKSIKNVEKNYKNKSLSYIPYERKLKSILKGKTKEEWIEYYNSYEYSLLKKIELIASQLFNIVYDDETYKQLATSKKQAVPVKERKIEVFNIDNEILKLKELMQKSHALPEAEAIVKKIDINIPEFEKIKEDIRRTEDASEKARVVYEEKQAKALAEKKSKEIIEPKKQKIVVAEEKPKAAAKIPSFKRNFFPKVHLKLPNVKFPKLNFSLKNGKQEFLSSFDKISSFIKQLHFSSKTKAKPVSAPSTQKFMSFSKIPDVQEEKPEKKTPKKKFNISDKFKSLFPKKKEVFVEEIVSMEKTSDKSSENEKIATEEAGVAFSWFSPKRFLAELTGKFEKKREPILGASTTVPTHMKKLREMRKKLYHSERLSVFDTTLLAQEAKRIKRILAVEKKEVYKGSSLGLIANVTVRKISLFFVNNFPQFFGYLYNSLRAANVRVLSNTYVNIMILVSLMLTVGTFFLLLFVFFALNYPIYQIALRSFIFSIIAGGLCASIFYTYPFMKIRERRRKTTVNLPFAINHMSAVATSGVPPARIFELIAASGEYDEVGVEVKKIVDFTNIFGYDLLTAIKAVASTTPSLVFRKFLEGLVSTIETGGDLVAYFRQQANEAALTYKLERQRYNETVSTYSDIYTGVLIAAPLFFIAAMAMINLLGGSLGGMGVGTVMALGSYVAIPLLNIGFIIFLQMTQPEV